MQSKEGCDRFLRELRAIYRNAMQRGVSESALEKERERFRSLTRPAERCSESEEEEFQQKIRSLGVALRGYRAPGFEEKQKPKPTSDITQRKLGGRPARTIKRRRRGARVIAEAPAPFERANSIEEILDEAYRAPSGPSAHEELEEVFGRMAIEHPEEEDLLKGLQKMKMKDAEDTEDTPEGTRLDVLAQEEQKEHPYCPRGVDQCDAITALNSQVLARARLLGRSDSLLRHQRYRDLVRCYKELCSLQRSERS